MAKPKAKTEELAIRYDEIHPWDEHAVKRLEELAIEAENDYYQAKSLYSGFLAASCWLDLGRKEESLRFYREHLPFITKDMSNPRSVIVYMNFARVLNESGLWDEGADVLDSIFPALPMISFQNILAAVNVYSQAKRFDKMWQLREETLKLRPQLEEQFHTPSLLEYQLNYGSREDALESLFDLLHADGIDDIEMEDVPGIMRIFRLMVTHPRICPEPDERIAKFLQDTEQLLTQFLVNQAEGEAEAGAEAMRRLNDPTDAIIPFEQVVKNLGLENAI